MPNRRDILRSRLAGAALALAAGFAPGIAPAAPVYKDAERFEDGARPLARRLPREERGPVRPARKITPGPGYVGSEWGLGKPNYWGIGPRPDWGYWDE